MIIFVLMFNIITRPTLLKYANEYPNGRPALFEWYHEFKQYNFADSNELKAVYGNASLIGDNRIIFNIKGNDFRLIIKINYPAKAAYILWFGTHNEYDKIDARSITF